MPRLTAPHKLENFAVIIRAMGGNGAADQRAALNELYRRRLWLDLDQMAAAIQAAGRAVPNAKDARLEVLAELGYCRAPVPLEARPQLPVIFRAETGSRHFHADVVAVFPTEPGTTDPSTFTVYAHTGQHSTGSRNWYRMTRSATETEAADLLEELRRIYERDDDPDAVRLVPVKRFTPQHDVKRKSAARFAGRAA